MTTYLFDREAHRYDAWYDEPEGAGLYAAELETLRPLIRETDSPRLEIGVGTGRFAAPLEMEYGIDPAVAPMRIAAGRGVACVAATGEDLPFRSGTFGAAVFVFTLCFVDDARRVIQEATRVTRPGGRVILGVVPADGPLGAHYRRLGEEGHRIYRHARFYTRADLDGLMATADLVTERRRSARIAIRDGVIVAGDVVDGDDPDAGFLVISTVNRTRDR